MKYLRLCKLGLLKIVERALAVATLDLLVAQRISGKKGGMEQEEDYNFVCMEIGTDAALY